MRYFDPIWDDLPGVDDEEDDFDLGIGKADKVEENRRF